ncbi:uncharacterized protein zda isoform X5 [Linepithema humile]|uniref:uncharacterized protein zda isoform X5 n=1 Tax=Linepithema humile TaxID=83485 RepID=UPI00351EEF70
MCKDLCIRAHIIQQQNGHSADTFAEEENELADVRKSSRQTHLPSTTQPPVRRNARVHVIVSSRQDVFKSNLWLFIGESRGKHSEEATKTVTVLSADKNADNAKWRSFFLLSKRKIYTQRMSTSIKIKNKIHVKQGYDSMNLLRKDPWSKYICI